MNRERWELLQRLLDTALELGPTDRDGFVARETEADPELRRELIELLAVHDQTSGPVDGLAKAWGLNTADADAPAPGSRIGPFVLVREVGRGGMGTVFVAERADEQFQQTVALKLMRDGVESAAMYQRFLRERQTLARLAHDNIARLIDGGLYGNERPWFAMEVVDGVPITRYCDERRLGIEQRLRLLDQVCAAVQYAHRNLVVHRDLKPSNILVTDAGVVKLLDFGVAKWLDESRDTDQAHSGRWMTLAYAAPEQIRGEPVTAATDVYALGALAYELVTGRRPLDDLVESDVAIRESAVLNRNSSAPSEAFGAGTPTLDARCAARRATASALRARLAGDIDTIVLKALNKEPEGRYATASALYDDIALYLSRRPIRAVRATRRYRARRFVQRNRLGVTAGALVLLAFLAGLAGTVWQAQVAADKARVAEQERDRAQVEALKSERVSRFLVNLFSSADPGRPGGDSATARTLLDRGRERIARDLQEQPEVRSAMMDVMGQAYAGIGLREDAIALLRGAEEIRRELGPDNLRELAQTLHHLGMVLNVDGAYAAAESSLVEARQAMADLGDPDYAEATYDLAIALHRKGEFQRAIPLFEETVDWYRSHGEDREEAAFGLETLGQIRSAQRRFGEAERYLREALDLRRRLNPGDNADTAADLVSLGIVLRTAGKLDEAELIASEGLATWRRIHEPPHASIATALHSVGRLRSAQERYAEAEAATGQALAMRLEVLEPSHPTLIANHYDLSDALVHTNKLDEAERHAREAMAMSRARFGERHPYVASGLDLLGRINEARGIADEAERYYREALDLAVDVLREGHPMIAQCETDLAQLLARTNRCAEAEPLFRSALANRTAIFGPEHRLTLQVRDGLEVCGG